MATSVIGPLTWSGSVDSEGYRTYKITYLVKGAKGCGPFAAMYASGIPARNSAWDITINGQQDSDTYAYCLPTKEARPHKVNNAEPFSYWEVDCTFTTKPQNTCASSTPDDPLSQPIRCGGNFIKFTEQARYDKDGYMIKGVSPWPPKGPLLEFDNNRPTVWVEWNSASLPLGTFAAAVDRVNSATMWGLAVRCVKLSNVTWEKKYYGSCSVYYTIRYEFEINYNTFDRKIPDISPLVLNGHWSSSGSWVTASGASVSDPASWIRFQDKAGNLRDVALTSGGTPATTESAVNIITAKKYLETNLSAILPVGFNF